MVNDALLIRLYQPADEGHVISLWESCTLIVPWNDPRQDIQRKLACQPDLFWVAVINGGIVGSVMAGYDGHRGWINYLAVALEHRHIGIGRQLMEVAEAALRQLGCPKINLQVRSSNTGVLAFYASLGFVPDEVVSMGKRL